MNRHFLRTSFVMYTLFYATTLSAQGPKIWIFGQNAGINFNSGNPVSETYPVNSCYTPVSSQCDISGNLLFYCDGKMIKNRDNQMMQGSSNPVWQGDVHLSMAVFSSIVPDLSDSNRYYVFMLTPSSGEPPFGNYYQGVLTYSVVDMERNGGLGGLVPELTHQLLDTNLDDKALLVVPAEDCGYWLISCKANNPDGKFVAYKVDAAGISEPVYSTVSIPEYPYIFTNMQMVYAYQHGKIIIQTGFRMLTVQDFNPATGTVSNAREIFDLAEFRNSGGGVTDPSFCLSPDEQYLYLLGYPAASGPVPDIVLRQFPINLDDDHPQLSASSIVFQSTDPQFMTSSTFLPYYREACAIRPGPDKKIYMFYNTGMSFLGKINKPNLPYPACAFEPKGMQLLPNTFGSYYLPSVENERIKQKTSYYTWDTTLCLSEAIILSPDIRDRNLFKFTWDDGSSDRNRRVHKEGVYWVKSIGTCKDGWQMDTFILHAEEPEKCNCSIFIPSAFSPNGDQLNEIFKPIIPITCINKGFLMMIYNRWGREVFRSYDVLKGWNGLLPTGKAESGTYYYLIRYIDFHNRLNTHKGDLTVIN